MDTDKGENCSHKHQFNTAKKSGERRILIIMLITLLTMAAEIAAGLLFNSIALLADGIHMSTHAAALGISLLAFVLARKYHKDERYTFGTWKIEILGAYTSAIVLGLVGLSMVYLSIDRLLNPEPIRFNEALLVAIIGLLINFVSALVLQHRNNRDHRHENGNAENPPHTHEHHDLNMKAAYLHVVTDALTSVFAIIALLGAKYFALNILDPLMGLVGAFLVLRWTVILFKETASVLLDREMHAPIVNRIRKIFSNGGVRITDLHVWRVGQNQYSLILALETDEPKPLEFYKEQLLHLTEIVHVSLELKKPAEKKERSSH